MGVDGRIEEQCWSAASAFELTHSIARALVEGLVEGVYPKALHLLHHPLTGRALLTSRAVDAGEGAIERPHAFLINT
jgi:hypothetical protein